MSYQPTTLTMSMEHAVVQAVEEENGEIDWNNNDDNETEDSIPVIHLHHDSHFEAVIEGCQETTKRPILDSIDLEEGGNDDQLEQHYWGVHHHTVSMMIPQAALVTTGEQDDDSGDAVPVQQQKQQRRAEFISVLFAPKGETTAAALASSIGVQFLPDSSGEIAQINEGSILSNSPLQAGDKLVSVNGKACAEMSFKDVSAFIFKSRRHNHGYLNMVFHNPFPAIVDEEQQENDEGGCLVQCMLMKEFPEDDFGITFGTFPGEVRIMEINSTGNAEQSLLNVGDVVLEVNDISCIGSTSQVVRDILESARKYVNISVRAGTNTAVVVSEVSSRFVNAQTVNTTGVADDGNPILWNNNSSDADGGPIDDDGTIKWPKWTKFVLLMAFLGYMTPILLSQRDSKKPSEHSHSSNDDCRNQNFRANETIFQYTNGIQTAALFDQYVVPEEANDHDGEKIDMNNNNATSDRMMYGIKIHGHGSFQVLATDKDLDPTNEQMNLLVENTNAFFSQVLEQNMWTTETFLSSRLVFQRWSYSICNESAWSYLELSVNLQANFSKPTHSLLQYHVRDVLERAVNSVRSTDYLEDYVRTVGGENDDAKDLLAIVDFATWDF